MPALSLELYILFYSYLFDISRGLYRYVTLVICEKCLNLRFMVTLILAITLYRVCLCSILWRFDLILPRPVVPVSVALAAPC